MLNFKSDKGELHIEATGSTVEILADFGIAVAAIYARLKKASPKTAEEFRTRLVCSLIDPASPIWNCTVPEDPDGITEVISIKK